MFTIFNSHVTFYTSYLGFNYVNTIGFILISLYVVQLVSGLQLSLYYNYSLSYYAFDSIQFIMKDVNIGYMIRIFHIIGSSFYMLFLWLHLLRGLFIKLFFYSFVSSVNVNSFVVSSFIYTKPLSGLSGAKLSASLASRQSINRIEVSFVNSFYFTFYYVYFIGIIIFLISIAVSFIGYTLVFGNLSYYGVIVILGLISSFPSLLSYLIQFLFLFISFLLILFIIVFLFLFIV